MTISMILLWIAVVFEFLLILGLVKRSEDARKDNEEIKKTIKKSTPFLTPIRQRTKTHTLRQLPFWRKLPTRLLSWRTITNVYSAMAIPKTQQRRFAELGDIADDLF